MAKAARRENWIREGRVPSLDELEWLVSAEAQAVCAAMEGGDPADTPAEIERWRDRLAPSRVTGAWTQVMLRRSARAKYRLADAMLFDRIALEQATDEVIAAYKARRFSGFGCVADLCCGIGGDAIALADGRDVVVMDWSAPRAWMAVHNAGVYGRGVSSSVGDVTFERPDADAAHVDPDRRATGRRRHDPHEGSPGIETLTRIIEQYGNVGIKLSPGAAFDELPFESEIELISHQGECRQAVAWTGELRRTLRRATVLPSGETVSGDTVDALAWGTPVASRIGELLFEPDPAVIRANLVGVVARRFGLAHIDKRIALLTGADVPATALLRAFRIIDTAPWSLKEARAWLGGHHVGRLEIKTRGFAGQPDDILRRLRLTGERSAVLFLIRLGERPAAILCERLRVDAPAGLPL